MYNTGVLKEKKNPIVNRCVLGESPKKINQELQNIHRITNGKVQYQSQDTSGEATSGLRLVLDLAMSDEVDILQFLIYFLGRFPQCVPCRE